MAKQIKIRVFPNGVIESETSGIKGKECLKYIKEIQQLTGAEIVESEFTGEYYEQEVRRDIEINGEQYGAN